MWPVKTDLRKAVITVITNLAQSLFLSCDNISWAQSNAQKIRKKLKKGFSTHRLLKVEGDDLWPERDLGEALEVGPLPDPGGHVLRHVS